MHEMGWCAWMVLTTPAHQTKVRVPWGQLVPEIGARGTPFNSPQRGTEREKILKVGVGEGRSLCSPST